MNKIVVYLCALMFITTNVNASEIEKNTAKLQAMDKITGRVNVIDVPVDSETKFGSLSIVVRKCKTRPVEETPDNFAFIDITDTDLKGEETNIFKGWMISSSPATHALEHPIYDIWLLRCIDADVDKRQLLNSEQLAQRDSLPMKRETISDGKTERKNTLKSNIINEMQSEKTEKEASEPEAIMQNEFSFDEDEDVYEDFVSEATDNQEAINL